MVFLVNLFPLSDPSDRVTRTDTSPPPTRPLRPHSLLPSHSVGLSVPDNDNDNDNDEINDNYTTTTTTTTYYYYYYYYNFYYFYYKQ